jgi:hypothetical protein
MSKIYKICLLQPREFLQSEGERTVIKEIDYMPDISVNFEIDGETYHVVSTYERAGMIGVRPFEYNEEVEEDLYEDNLTCPYCGYEDGDSFELSDEGETDCGRCGSEIEYERVVEVKYVSTPKKKNEVVKI